VKLFLTADPLDLKTGEFSTVEALLKDASGNPVGGFPIDFQVKNGYFEEGVSPYRAALNPAGRATIHVSSSTSDTVKVWAQANNSEDSVSLVFTAYTLTLSASPSSIVADGASTSMLTATYKDGSGNPMVGKPITFATNAGSITTAVVNTNSLGVAQTPLKSAEFATFAIVQANAAYGQAKDTVLFTASTVADVALTISPDNVSTNGGSAILTAIVTDVNGNMVSGASVNFRIVTGPGGDEYITKPVVITQDGIAQSTLKGGSLPSPYRGCEVEASVGAVSDRSKLTISGEPYIITVSRPQDDTVEVPNVGVMDESTFEFFIGAVVQDINGNPVADNTEVHFSAVVSGLMVKRLVLDYWSGIGSAEEIKAVLAYAPVDVLFEDINNNYNMDANVDLKLDFDDLKARRGDDYDGDGDVEYNLFTDDFFYDYNGNGICNYTAVGAIPGDAGYHGEPYYVDRSFGTPILHKEIYADLNQNGQLDTTELYIDRNGNDRFELGGVTDPFGFDFRFSLWEMRPMWRGARFDFADNDFAVVIDASASTKEGVAYARITYPRQLAHRIIVTINAETNGIRDKDGERFLLPVVKGGG
jgi:hypothetical protein